MKGTKHGVKRAVVVFYEILVDCTFEIASILTHIWSHWDIGGMF